MAVERCETKRAAFAGEISLVSRHKLVFLDECGFGLNLHRVYGWTIGGGRCVEAVRFERGQNRSVLGAFSLPTPDCPSGMRVLWQKLGAWTRATFLDTGHIRGVFAGRLVARVGEGQRLGVGQRLNPSGRGHWPVGRESRLFFALPAA